MAIRTWGRLLLTALGVSVVAGAGQLGIAYGFGIVRLTDSFADATANRWPAQLVWVGWFAAIAAVVGAVLTERLFRREDLPANATTQLSVAAAAALGATVVAPLSMQPARAAQFASIDPVWAVGICAILGAVVGAGAALAVLLRPPLGWNVALTAGTIWLIALISVVPSLATTGPLPTVRLGVLEPSWLDREAAQRLAMLILPAVGLLAGAASGALARVRGHLALVGGASGVAGPALIAFAYLTAGPGSAVDRYQTAPYYAALIAVALGVLGSTAATLVRWPLVAGHAPADAIEPTDILRPLPTGPAPIGATTTGSPADGGTPGDEPGSVDLIRPRTDAVDPASGVGGPRRDLFQDNRGDRLGGTATPHTVPAHWDWPPASGTGSPVPTGPSLAPLTVPSVAGPPRPRDEDRTAGPAPADPTATPASRGPAAAGTPDEPDSTGTPTNETPAGPGSTGTPTTETPTGPGSTGAPADADAAAASDASTGTPTVRAQPARRKSTARATEGTSTKAAPVDPDVADAVPPPATAPERTDPAARQNHAPVASADTPLAGQPDHTPAARPKRARKARSAPAPAMPVTDALKPTGSAAGDPKQVGSPTGSHEPAVTPDSAGAVDPASASEPAGDPETTDTPEPAGSRPAATPTRPPAPLVDPAGAPAIAALFGEATPGSSRTSLRRPADARFGTSAAAPQPARPPAPVPQPARAPAAPPQPARPPAAPPQPAPAQDPSPAAPQPARPPAAAPQPAPGQDPSPAAPQPARPPAPAQSPPDAAPQPARPSAAVQDRAPVQDQAPVQDRAPAQDRAAALNRAAAQHRAAQDRRAAQGHAAPQDRSDLEPSADSPTTGGPTPRPRHRAPLPDLGRGLSWDAFGNAARAGGPPPTAERTPGPGPALDAPARPAERVGAGPSDDPAPDDPGSGAPEPPASEATPDTGKSRRRRGLFRRNRDRATDAAAGSDPPREAEPVPAHDEEYVDWVTGLARPAPEPDESENARPRTRRSSGRHHRD